MMKTYRQLVRFCKQRFPLPYPVSIRRVKMGDDYDGNCSFNEDRFLIKINRKLPEHQAIETVLHEYAHAIAWDRCISDCHCAEWGKAYSRVYRVFLKDFLEES